METLGRLFGSTAIIKILRLFLFNPDCAFEAKGVIKRTKVDSDTVRTEVSMLERIGFLKRRSFYKEIEYKKSGRMVRKKKRVSGWILDSKFVYLESLQRFFIQTASVGADEVSKKLRNVGKLKLVIVSGVFIQNWDSRIDLLIVGDAMKKLKLDSAIKDIEAELGKELRYAAFSTNDFKYRLSMRDRLVRDILDFPHLKLVNRIASL